MCTALLAATLSLPSLTGGALADDLIRIGEGPFITGGGFFIANAKGYFKKLGIDIQTRQFNDGVFAVPSLISGELDMALMTANASLFNSIAKGAPIVVILDRGNNRVGRAYTVVNVTNAVYAEGVHGPGDFAKLKGKRIGVGAVGSINQYTIAQGLIKAGLDPAKDVHWIVNIPQPDLMKMLGQNQVDATDLAYQFGFFARNNKTGPMVATDDQLEPGTEIATYVVRKGFLDEKRDVVVRFAMAYLQGVREFNAAAGDPDHHPDIVDILANHTFLKTPGLVKAIAPNWSYLQEDGLPLVDSIMKMQDFWSGKYFHYVEKRVTREQLFDLGIAKEAKARLDKDNPFGK
jgi:NitT/TauT family transport system substrate-binding protein